MKKYFTKADIIVIVVLFILPVFLMAFTYSSGPVVNNSLEVTVGGKTTIYSMKVHRFLKFRNNKLNCTVEIKDNKARIIKTGCPNKICAKKGWISDRGSSIICAPMALTLEIKGIGKGNLDALNY